MKIKQIKIAFGRTVNLGNFESERIDVEMVADLDDSEDVDLAYEKLRLQVKNRLNEELENA